MDAEVRANKPANEASLRVYALPSEHQAVVVLHNFPSLKQGRGRNMPSVCIDFIIIPEIGLSIF
jgi:hypothetical protein